MYRPPSSLSDYHSLASMVPGAILLPVGLLISGWTARADVHWIAPDIGIALVGAGTILNFQSIQTYVIDAFTLHAASGESSGASLNAASAMVPDTPSFQLLLQ